jgi:ribonuclease P protein component
MTVVHLPARSSGGAAVSADSTRATRWSRPAGPGGPAEVRVAYAIGRKVGPAVVRNRLRRRLRAAVRQLDRTSRGLPGGAYLVSLRPEAATMTYAELKRDLGAAIATATDRARSSRASGTMGASVAGIAR